MIKPNILIFLNVLLFRDLRDCGLSPNDIKVLEITLKDFCYKYNKDAAQVKIQKVIKRIVQGGRESAILSLSPMNRTLRSLKSHRFGRNHNINPLIIQLSANAILQFSTTPDSFHMSVLMLQMLLMQTTLLLSLWAPKIPLYWKLVTFARLLKMKDCIRIFPNLKPFGDSTEKGLKG